MHYCILSKVTKEVLDVRNGTDAIRKAVNERSNNADVFVRPIMLRIDFYSLCDDYRGEKDGTPFVLYLDPDGGGTTYGPVMLLDNWGKWSGELQQKVLTR